MKVTSCQKYFIIYKSQKYLESRTNMILLSFIEIWKKLLEKNRLNLKVVASEVVGIRNGNHGTWECYILTFYSEVICKWHACIISIKANVKINTTSIATISLWKLWMTCFWVSLEYWFSWREEKKNWARMKSTLGKNKTFLSDENKPVAEERLWQNSTSYVL